MENTLNEILRRVTDSAAKELIANAPTRQRFCFPIDTDTAACLLTTAYLVEVKARALQPKASPELSHQLAAVAKWLTTPTLKPSLLLYGGQPGTGKTTTVKAIISMAKQLQNSFGPAGIDRQQQQLKRCLTPAERREFESRETAIIVPKYYTALDLAQIAREDRQRFNNIAESRFIAVDDMGTEPIRVNEYGNELLPLVEVISRRYEKQLPTIITTNLNLKTLCCIVDNSGNSREMYGARIVDRLREMCETIAYNSGVSYRV